MKVRKIALKLLSDYEESGTYVNLSLSSHLTDSLTREERSLLTALLYTTVERKLTLDYMISALSGRGIAEIYPYTKNILRLGLCQVIYMEKIPDFAAVNETVKLTRGGGERSFVNAVLREAVRRKSDLPLPPREKNLARHLSVCYSIPLWIVKYLLSELGEQECEALLRTFNEKAPLTVAVNTLKITRDAYLKQLHAVGISAEPTLLSEYGIRIFENINPRGLLGFSEGLFYVQDEASQLVGAALGAIPGDRVVDVCSCPGGKSFLSALRMNNEGEIHAFDVHENKLSLISDGAKRLGINIIKTRAVDGEKGYEPLYGKANRVIADVPCSGLGVIGKKPDLRYKSEESVRALPALALNILNTSAKYLSDGGTLVYSTCTLRREENEQVVLAFLDTHPDFALVPWSIGGHVFENGIAKTYPHRDGCDGFFIAKLIKKM